MKVKVTQEILDAEGTAVPKNDKGEALTVRDVMVVCLQTPLKGDEEDSGAARMKKFDVMKKLFSDKKEIDLEATDITIMKDRVLKVYPSPVIYGRMCEAFGESK